VNPIEFNPSDVLCNRDAGAPAGPPVACVINGPLSYNCTNGASAIARDSVASPAAAALGDMNMLKLPKDPTATIVAIAIRTVAAATPRNDLFDLDMKISPPVKVTFLRPGKRMSLHRAVAS